MIIHQVRNATLVLELGPYRWLVDPMLAPRATLPGFRLAALLRKRNPLVELPASADALLATVNGALVTHEHPDHFDAAGRAFVKARSLPVYTHRVDLDHLRSKGFDARLLSELGGDTRVEVVRSRHGRGPIGWLLGPVCGYFIAHPDEPTVYLTGDSILTDAVLDAAERLRPDVIVAPAGAANFGVGADILFSVDELVTLARRTSATLVLNHLEALDHCPTTRASLRARMEREGLLDRVRIPADGESLRFDARGDGVRAQTRAEEGAPGIQKWVTQRFSGA